MFRYFVEFKREFELFVLFSFKPTKKPVNGSHSTFLSGAFASKSFLNVNFPQHK